MKRFLITLRVVHEINADDEEEALGIFWDELHSRQAEGELATVDERDNGGTAHGA